MNRNANEFQLFGIIDDPNAAFGTIIKRTHELLKPQGFRRQGQKFWLNMGLSVFWVNLAKSPWRESQRHPVDFYLVLAMELRPPNSPPLAGAPKYLATHITTDAGTWEGGVQDVWRVKTIQDADSVWPRVESRLLRFALPFSERCASIEGMKDIALMAKSRHCTWKPIAARLREHGVSI